jgi:hypothetical protein
MSTCIQKTHLVSYVLDSGSAYAPGPRAFEVPEPVDEARGAPGCHGYPPYATHFSLSTLDPKHLKGAEVGLVFPEHIAQRRRESLGGVSGGPCTSSVGDSAFDRTAWRNSWRGRVLRDSSPSLKGRYGVLACRILVASGEMWKTLVRRG